MATDGNTFSEDSLAALNGLSSLRVAIVVSSWNKPITQNLLDGAINVFKKASCKEIIVRWVPGSFELPLGSKQIIQSEKVDGVVAIGNVIQGETKHFDFVCQGVTQGIMNVMLDTNTPISFCLLTDLNLQQSLDRSGGKLGNKGHDCAIALLQMIKGENQSL
jgi:6,7-dimethyl-8-ribityllumazine synthase